MIGNIFNHRKYRLVQLTLLSTWILENLSKSSLLGAKNVFLLSIHVFAEQF